MFLLTTEFKHYLKQLVHHASTDLSDLPFLQSTIARILQELFH
jgi:hypothetical protein